MMRGAAVLPAVAVLPALAPLSAALATPIIPPSVLPMRICWRWVDN